MLFARIVFVGRLFISALLVYTLTLSSSWAETEQATTEQAAADDSTRYIIDRLYISLRESGREGARSVVRGLRSGTELKFIQQDEESGYSQVETLDGEKGWIKTRYLQTEPTAALMIPELQQKITELSAGSDASLLKEIDRLRKENKKLDKNKTKLEKELKEIKHASANVIRINEQNHELIEKNQILQSEVDSLEAIHEQFKADESTTFFIYGGLLVLLTVVLMSIYDGIKRRRSYGSEW